MSSQSKQILVVSLSGGREVSGVHVKGHAVVLHIEPYPGDIASACALVENYDGQVSAIALHGLPAVLQLGDAQQEHSAGCAIRASATQTPVVDGYQVRSDLEEWGIGNAARKEPGLFARKRVLMCPGLNNVGLANALEQQGSELRYADPFVFFGLPHFPGVGSRFTLGTAATATVEALRDTPFERLMPSPDAAPNTLHKDLFEWADIIAGDTTTICRFAPPSLSGKTLVVECASEGDIEEFKGRGAETLITVMPSLNSENELAAHSAAVVEAALVATRPDPDTPLTADDYLNLVSTLSWQPGIRRLCVDEAPVNRFAFVIHPIAVGFIRKHRLFRWTRLLPASLVEWCAAHLPPLYLSRITGARSPQTGQRVEGTESASIVMKRTVWSRRSNRLTSRRIKVEELCFWYCDP